MSGFAAPHTPRRARARPPPSPSFDSLRAIDPDRFAIVDETAGGEVIEEIEASKAFWEVYDGAVYMFQVGRTVAALRGAGGAAVPAGGPLLTTGMAAWQGRAVRREQGQPPPAAMPYPAHAACPP